MGVGSLVHEARDPQFRADAMSVERQVDRTLDAGLENDAIDDPLAANASVSHGSGSRIYFATSRSSDHGPDLGFVITSRINGRAGWWKSPCPDLARARGG
jgi:hypothetical protein